MIQVKLLGDFAVLLDGDAVAIRSVKARLLLACIALAGGSGRRREELQALLWGDYPTARAQANLRWTLHRLRSDLPEPARGLVRSDKERVWLDRDDVRIDAVDLQIGAADEGAEALSRAANLYRGPFLADVTLDDPEIDQWVLQERAHLHDLAARLHWDLFSYHVWRRDLARAEVCARRWLRFDPDCERMRPARDRLRQSQLTGRRAGSPAYPAPWVLGEEAPPSLDGRPAVLVLPFVDRSEGAVTEWLAAALTDDLIFDLTRFREIAVFARDTSQAVGGDEQVRAIGAQYVVKGVVTRDRGRIALRVGLSERASGRQLLVDQREAPVELLAEIRTRISGELAGALPAAIEDAELARLGGAREIDASAYELYLIGRQRMETPCGNTGPPPSHYFEKALERDPNFAPAHAGLAAGHFLGGRLFDGTPWSRRLDLALHSALTAVRLDDLSARNHALLAGVFILRREFDEAERHLDLVPALNPNDAESLVRASTGQAYLGHDGRAEDLVRHGLGLNPRFPGSFAERAGVCAYAAGRHDDALGWLRHCADRIIPNRGWMVASAVAAGRRKEADEHLRCLKESVKRYVPARELRESGGLLGWLRRFVAFRDSRREVEFADLVSEAGLR